ncbi:unnamed protein product [Parascedosporium putredinis]|uniref:Major facilitator superfamily (MFS) profile domain-containing protein n=1 Tax=Parascedosporium putredinis TaxID=1442378 RepID=A0A9P1H1B1_9PEZI|nr:unnamed protein product [Parascedosporium putredinis]CAI7993582.1 unnamed protein product [Parascedosporium putredinis]
MASGSKEDVQVIQDGASTPELHDLEKAPANVQMRPMTDVEILQRSWSKKAMIIAFAGLFATSFVCSFVKYSTKVYDAYATSAFSKHSALTTANIVYTITSLVTYPIMAKLSNVFGRPQGFFFAIFFMTLSMVLYAACQDIGTYIAGGIFESIGDTGFTIMQQIFIADTTSLINRGFWASLPESLALGLRHVGHYPPLRRRALIVTMYVLQRRATKNGFIRKSIWTGETAALPLHKRIIRLVWIDLDIVGAVLMVIGLGLALIPLSLTGSKNSQRWKEGSTIAMLVVGIVVLCVFLVWDTRFAKTPFVPFRMIREKTVIAACLLSLLDFFHYSTFTLFFPSYLQVVGGYSPGHASRIDNALRVSFQIASVLVGLLMKFTKRSHMFVLIGVPLVVLGQGLQIYFVNKNGDGPASEVCFITAKTLVGVGRAFYQTAAQVSIQAIVDREDVPVVTGVYYAAMSVGGAIGTSVGGAIWNSLLPSKLSQYLPDSTKSMAQAIYKSIAYRETQQKLAIAATAGLAPMIFIMFAMKNVDLAKAQEEKDLAEGSVHEHQDEAAKKSCEDSKP